MLKKLQIKSWLLMLCMLVGVGNAWAEDVTFSPSDFTATTSNDYSLTKDAVTVAVTGSTVTSSQIRVFKGKTMKISSTNTITGISFECTASGTAQYGPGCFAAQDGYSYDGKIGTWTGSSNEITFTASSNQVRITSLVITYEPGGTPTVATPVFNPEGGIFAEAQSVTISCSTEGAAIQYSTDNGATWTNYMAAISVSETTTIQAKATKTDYNDSQVASATYTIEVPSSIADVREQETGDVFTKGIVTSCVGTTGYIQDATAAICVYGASLTVGDEITVSGTLSTYRGLLEITNPTVNVLSSGNNVTSTVMTIADINATNAPQGKYVKIVEAIVTAIDGQNTTIEQDGASIVVRGISSDVEYAVGDALTLEGNIGCFDVAQIANPQNVVVQKSEKQEAGLAYETTEYTINLGESFTAPTLTNPNNLAVTYESSNTELATVDENGTVTLVAGATGTTTITASFAGNDTYLPGSASYTLTVVDPNAGDFTWDLSTDSYDANPTEDLIAWSCDFATMSNAKGTSSTAVTNYIPTTRTSTRMYSGNQLTIEPVSGYVITKVVFTATTEGYATALANSTWTNATVTASNMSVTVIPTDGSTAMEATIGATCGFTSVVVTYEKDSKTSVTITFKDEAGASIDNLTLNINEEKNIILNVEPEGIQPTISNSDATIATYADGIVKGLAAGTTTITATYAGDENHHSATKTLTITVVDPNANDGSAEKPYTVAEAIAYISTLGSSTSPSEVYVKGIISQVDSYNSNYSSITYWISDDGETTMQMQVYSGKGLESADFSSKEDLQVGDQVTVCGYVKLYESTPEFDKNNYLVNYEPAAEKTEPGLAYETTEFNVNLGEPFTAPTLTNPNNLTVTYTSSNEDVATVDATTGIVTIVAGGSATITAFFSGNDIYKAGEASYTIKVKDPSIVVGEYELVTDAATLKAGDEIVFGYIGTYKVSGTEYETAQVMSTEYNSTNNIFGAIDMVSHNDNIIEIQDGTAIITLAGSAEAWTFQMPDGKYLVSNGRAKDEDGSGNPSKNENIIETTEDNTDTHAQATIAIDGEGNATVLFQGGNGANNLCYNVNSGKNQRFSCYVNKMTGLQIYRKVASSETVPGDVNKDGSRTIADVTALVNIILGKATPEANPEYDFDAADVNGDGGVPTIADVTALVNIILGKDQ
ncbi:MAG: Ig-like domain-containing protein [Bacteroidaceae bacterium]|nr:Ig-like domain-containing protein [Bacteroidaceae bacterium]